MMRTDDSDYWPEVIYDTQTPVCHCAKTVVVTDSFTYLRKRLATAERRGRFWFGAFWLLALAIVCIAAWLALGGWQ